MEAALERWNTLRAQDILTVTYPWRIDNFSTSCKGKKYSPVFYNSSYKWRILMYPKGLGVDQLSVYLDIPGAAKLPAGWSRLARFSLTVVNQLDRGRSVTKETVHMFDHSDSDWGFTSLIPLVVFNDHSQGYLVDDTCVIEATVAVPKPWMTTLVNQTVSSAPVQPLGAEIPVAAQPVEVPVNAQLAEVPVDADPAEVPVNGEPIDSRADSPVVKTEPLLSSLPSDEVADFRGFGKVDKAFVPLLQEVCTLHPSLVECQQNQSVPFTEWAFSTLGRMLYFLKTKKPKDITEEACLELRKVWTELQVFRFDLSWLEPDFERALQMKNQKERARKLQEELNTLDTQRKRLKAELAAVEDNYEDAQRKVAEADELLETELGYGRFVNHSGNIVSLLTC